MSVYKYIVLAPIPEPNSSLIMELIYRIAEFTKIQQHMQLKPHITLHRPLALSEDKIIQVVESVLDTTSKITVTLGGLSNFGSSSIILPVHTTLELALFWVNLYQQLYSYPDYVAEVLDKENSLHVTLASKVRHISIKDLAEASEIKISSSIIQIETIEILRKDITRENSRWEKIKKYSLQN